MATKAAIDFFFKHGAFTYGSGETKAQGKRRSAREHAEAEALAEDLGWTFEWEDDPSGWDSFDDEDRAELSEVLSVVLRDENGKVLGSLGGVGFGQNSVDNKKYARTVEAEVALDALIDKGIVKRAG